jgi:hypothetical protein
MSRANQTGVTQRGQILEISFDTVHFLIFLKMIKIQKNIPKGNYGEGIQRLEKGLRFSLSIQPFFIKWLVQHL